MSINPFSYGKPIDDPARFEVIAASLNRFTAASYRPLSQALLSASAVLAKPLC